MNLEKHDTASAFIFDKCDGDWKALLVHHKKFKRWMVPGGHVERNENQEEALIREVLEETGITIKLLSLENVGEQFRNVFQDAREVALPFAIVEEEIQDMNGNLDHFHLDFLYFGMAMGDVDISMVGEEESKELRWFGRNDLAEVELFQSTEYYLEWIFKKLSEL